MEKKSKEQLRVEEYFEENNIVHNETIFMPLGRREI